MARLRAVAVMRVLLFSIGNASVVMLGLRLLEIARLRVVVLVQKIRSTSTISRVPQKLKLWLEQRWLHLHHHLRLVDQESRLLPRRHRLARAAIAAVPSLRHLRWPYNSDLLVQSAVKQLQSRSSESLHLLRKARQQVRAALLPRIH